MFPTPSAPPVEEDRSNKPLRTSLFFDPFAQLLNSNGNATQQQQQQSQIVQQPQTQPQMQPYMQPYHVQPPQSQQTQTSQNFANSQQQTTTTTTQDPPLKSSLDDLIQFASKPPQDYFVSALQEMGFSEEVSKKAANAVQYKDLQVAIAWIIENEKELSKPTKEQTTYKNTNNDNNSTTNTNINANTNTNSSTSEQQQLLSNTLAELQKLSKEQLVLREASDRFINSTIQTAAAPLFLSQFESKCISLSDSLATHYAVLMGIQANDKSLRQAQLSETRRLISETQKVADSLAEFKRKTMTTTTTTTSLTELNLNKLQINNNNDNNDELEKQKKKESERIELEKRRNALIEEEKQQKQLHLELEKKQRELEKRQKEQSESLSDEMLAKMLYEEEKLEMERKKIEDQDLKYAKQVEANEKQEEQKRKQYQLQQLQQQQQQQQKQKSPKNKWNQRYCELCSQMKPSEDCRVLKRCNHQFCSDCLSSYVTNLLRYDAARDKIKCPSYSCQSGMEIEEIRASTYPDLFEKHNYWILKKYYS